MQRLQSMQNTFFSFLPIFLWSTHDPKNLQRSKLFNHSGFLSLLQSYCTTHLHIKKMKFIFLLLNYTEENWMMKNKYEINGRRTLIGLYLCKYWILYKEYINLHKFNHLEIWVRVGGSETKKGENIVMEKINGVLRRVRKERKVERF